MSSPSRPETSRNLVCEVDFRSPCRSEHLIVEVAFLLIFLKCLYKAMLWNGMMVSMSFSLQSEVTTNKWGESIAAIANLKGEMANSKQNRTNTKRVVLLCIVE